MQLEISSIQELKATIYSHKELNSLNHLNNLKRGSQATDEIEAPANTLITALLRGPEQRIQLSHA